MASIPLPSHSIASPILTQVNLNNMNPSTSQTTQPSSSTKRESRKSAERIPRPRNAWILYRSAMIKTLTPPPPGARRRTQGEISRILAPMWASATPEVRAFYQDEAAREKAEHAARYPDYKFAPVKKEVREQQRKEKKRQERSVRGTRRRETRSSPEPSLRPGRAAPSRQKTDMPLGLMEEEPRGLGIEAGPTQLQMPQPSRAYIPSQRYLSLPSPASSSQPHNIPARQCPPPLSPQGWQPTVLTAAPRRAVRQQVASSRAPSALSSSASFASTSTSNSSMFQLPSSDARSQSLTDPSLFDEFELNIGMGQIGPQQEQAAGDLWLSSSRAESQWFPPLQLGQQQVEEWEWEQRRARFESSCEPPPLQPGEDMMNYLNLEPTDLERDGAFDDLFDESQGSFNLPQHPQYQDPFASLPDMQYTARWPLYAS